MQWPTFDGNDCHFIGQIDCSELPKNLWMGLGPRMGWVLFFFGEGKSGWGIKVFHTTDLGSLRQSPKLWSSSVVRLRAAEQASNFEPARWPVEFVGCDNENRASREKVIKPERRFDPANPLHLPHDEETFNILLELAKAHLLRVQKRERNRVVSLTKSLGSPLPETGVPRAIFFEAMEMLYRAERIDTDLPFSEECWLPYEASFHRINAMVDGAFFLRIPQPKDYRELKEAVHMAVGRASTGLYDCMDVPQKRQDELEQVKSGIEHVEVSLLMIQEAQWTRGRHSGKRFFDYEYSAKLIRKLAERNIFGPVLYDFVRLSARCAARRYVNTGKLDFPGHERFIELWARQAPFEEAHMGGRAACISTSVWTNSTDVVLFELGSSEMFGWEWGDLQKVIVKISLLDLQAMNFAAARAELPD